MKNLPIDIPKPSEFIKHSIIDDIANEVNKIYRIQLNDTSEQVSDVEKFIDSYLQINILWDEIAEPENRICFAKLSCENDEYTITLNENHRSLFDSKLFLLRSCLSHETGHYVLRHFEKMFSDESQRSLFGDDENQPKYLHDSAWSQLGLSRVDFINLKNHLAKTFWKNQQDRDLLKTLADRIEPQWMYLQAEQFSSCFLIPKDKLLGFLNNGLDLTNWQSLYLLKDTFGVSISMIVVRLEKLGLIKVIGKQITLIEKPKQSKMWA